ncbi:hypothetical protein PT974_09853 [Cladobotryum mycophilum]|uniref:Uncharacterized protein n=1 Tax=Cladobotryum mycophilum TaxID=491253 RepID=A0ABR0SHB9_9HYPO
MPIQGGLTFGDRYAVLNLDLMTALINQVKETAKGQLFIRNCSSWIDAVNQQHPRPLTIFTSLCFVNPKQSELPADAPFTKLVNAFSIFDAGSPAGAN